MSRFKGTFIFGANFEGGSTVPIDARQLVGTYADLTLPATWCFSPVCSTQAIYDGMVTVVAADPSPENNGIYWLCDAANYTNASSWQSVGGGTSNLSGATNGLSLFSGNTYVGLGGTLSEAITTVCATGFSCYWIAKGSDSALADGIYYDNANAAFIGKTFDSGDCYSGAYFSTNGAQFDAGNSLSGTSSCLQLHLDGNACFQTSNALTISSDNSCPAAYLGDYSSAYSCLSIPNAGWVTGQTGAIGANNGLSREGNNIVLGGPLTGVTEITMSGATSLTFTDTRTTTCGILYGGDYEDDFVPRSLVTAQYVTGYTQDVSNTVAVCNVNTAYTATTENDFIGVSGATSVWLPLSPKACQRITVADIEGDALTNMIVICGNGIDINGSPTATINTNYGSMTFINNNISGWSAVAFIN